MGRISAVSIIHRRALNQAIIYAGRVPTKLIIEPAVFVRALRCALRMSQAQLSRRSGIPQGLIAQLEAGIADSRVSTIRRLFDTMFCDMLVLPRPRKRPGDVLAERRLDGRSESRMWAD